MNDHCAYKMRSTFGDKFCHKCESGYVLREDSQGNEQCVASNHTGCLQEVPNTNSLEDLKEDGQGVSYKCVMCDPYSGYFMRNPG